MRESENSVQANADHGPEAVQRVCANLLADQPRYATWISLHDKRMWRVARGQSRTRQLTDLRHAATDQIHRAALVRYLRDNQISGDARQLVLREFYGSLEVECAVLTEHRSYTRAVSSQLCAEDLLQLGFDRFGVQMLNDYQREYGLYFAMHCDRLRAKSKGRQYLLAYLLPEVKETADKLRTKILSGESLPSPRLSLSGIWRSPVANHPFERQARIAR